MLGKKKNIMGTKNEVGEREYNPGWENMIAETCMGFIGEKPTSLNFQIGKTWIRNHWATQMDEFRAWEKEENHKIVEKNTQQTQPREYRKKCPLKPPKSWVSSPIHWTQQNRVSPTMEMIFNCINGEGRSLASFTYVRVPNLHGNGEEWKGVGD